MKFSLSNKLLIYVCFFVLLIQLTCGQDDADDFDSGISQEEMDEINSKLNKGPRCPEQYVPFYEDCKGNLKKCSQCIADAYKKCRAQQALDWSNNVELLGSCWQCNEIVGETKCDKREGMCFGYQDCGGGDAHCVNFKCKIDSPYII